MIPGLLIVTTFRKFIIVVLYIIFLILRASNLTTMLMMVLLNNNVSILYIAVWDSFLEGVLLCLVLFNFLLAIKAHLHLVGASW